MSGKNTIALHFGVYLEGTENQFLYYDASTGLTTNFTLPEGVYFFTHYDATQQINAVLTALLAGSFPAFACTQPDDRTLAWTMGAAGDYIRLVPTTGNDDDVKLARLLGLYTAAGDMTYYQTNNIPAASFTTLSSFFSESGLLYETYDLSGFPVWNSEYSLTESGNVNVVNSSRKQEVQLQLTCLAGFDFRGIADYPAGSYGSWSNSFWGAYDPSYQTPDVYLKTSGDSLYTYHAVIMKPVGKDNVKPVKQGYNGLFNLTMDLYMKASYEI